jgi:cytochrome d ubiquinol oxidase subunit II
MLYVVLFFLLVSLLLYVILAGADFGAGIVELFSSEQNQKITKKTVYSVMGPVWEANHIWIIILVVILWVGFPEFYNVLVVSLTKLQQQLEYRKGIDRNRNCKSCPA